MGKKILFIGNYTDDETYDLITKNEIRDLSQAARLFQQRLINSIAELTDDFYAVSLLPTDKKTILPATQKDTKVEVEVIPLVNKSAKSAKEAMKRLIELIRRECGKETCALMYAVNPIAFVPLLRLKKKYRLTLLTICPELPQFRRYKKSIQNFIKRNVFTYLNQRFDKYIIFAEAMKEYLPKGRPCMLLEGFAPEQIQEPHIRERNIAMYAGGLAEDNGIKMMIEAAHKSSLIDELWICGSGDCLEYVKANVDKKITYLGRLANFEVLEYEKRAKVLLNARNPENELTKFSFPSKVLEYMASGGVVISSKLAGIPKEYEQFIALLQEYSVDSLAYEMDKVFSMTEREYLEVTSAAINFIQNKKAKTRCRELLGFATK